jgi:hypothetical protein
MLMGAFFQNYQRSVWILCWSMLASFLTLIIVSCILLFQLKNYPQPLFSAIDANGQLLRLNANDEPNLMANALLKWASQAAINLYTFRFSETNNEIYQRISPYFTATGGAAYYNSLTNVLATLKQNKINTHCAVTGQPVIANQGKWDNFEMTWRIQIPFLVTFEGAGILSTKFYRVTLLLTKMPTTIEPAGIAIEQFRM